MHPLGFGDGARAVAPMLVGVVPFGIIAGAIPIENGLGVWTAIACSTIVFAGASQLALYDVLADGGSWLVAAIAAWTINARLLLYSASLAPHLDREPVRRRLLLGYLLSDQAYAVSIARFTVHPEAGGRFRFVLGAGLTLWLSWQASTLAGALAGNSLPEDAPIDAIVPLVFLVLLLPVLRTRPALAAAAAGGVGALIASQAGAGGLATLVGALAGIITGAIVEQRSKPA